MGILRPSRTRLSSGPPVAISVKRFTRKAGHIRIFFRSSNVATSFKTLTAIRNRYRFSISKISICFRRVHRFHSCAMSTLTIARVAVSCGADPEFVDVVGLRERFGIKRSLAYKLLKDGAIRGVSLRRKGQVRGKRLFDVASVRDFLRGNMEAENA
jgi:hypothetical protein